MSAKQRRQENQLKHWADRIIADIARLQSTGLLAAHRADALRADVAGALMDMAVRT